MYWYMITLRKRSILVLQPAKKHNHNINALLFCLLDIDSNVYFW
jgi:hypothetical protein